MKKQLKDEMSKKPKKAIWYNKEKGECSMAYRTGERNQMTLLPPSIEDYVGEDDPVRAYDAFAEALDIKELGMELNDSKVGNPEYNPKAMLKLFIYGLSYGFRSSRKLERALHHNISFMWLMGGLKPDHKTISEFRRKHIETIKRVFKQCARLCLKFNLIEGSILFTDGSKIRASAGRSKSHDSQYYQEYLREVDKKIEKLLTECGRIDEAEKETNSLVKTGKEISKLKNLKNTVNNILEEFKEQGDKTKDGKPRKKNLTDSDSALMRSRQGSHANYNVQSVVDDKNGLIVNIDAVSEANDSRQLANQIKQAEETTGKECKVVCADSGYSNVGELEKIDCKNRKIIVPSQKQALHDKKEKPFSKEHFKYDKEKDCYYCPEGQTLKKRAREKKSNKIQYQISNAEICKKCEHYKMCTSAKEGRKITRLAKEELKEKFERQYEEAQSQEIYKRRKEHVEHPFGHIKRNLGLTGFLLRGREKVKAEISLAATCFNIARMITIFGGVQALVLKLRSP